MKNISLVVNSGLCVGCGTCVSVCPNNAISLYLNHSSGLVRAQIDHSKCSMCGLCIRVCPAIDLVIYGEPKPVGKYLKIFYGYSRDRLLRYISASGGIVSSIFKYLLEQDLVDGVIAARSFSRNPFICIPTIITKADDIMKFAGSRYSPTPMNIILKYIERVEGTFAIVGTPCVIYGLTKYLGVRDIREKILLKIGLFCGGIPSINAYKYYLKIWRIDTHKIVSIRRGYGWPGHDVIEYPNGKKVFIPRRSRHSLHRVSYAITFLPVYTFKRCLICVDRFASFADISVGDAWHPKFKHDTEGVSMIIVRSKKGLEILEDMERRGYIYLEETDEESLRVAQKRSFDYFMNLYSTLKILNIKRLNLLFHPIEHIDLRWIIEMVLVNLISAIPRPDRLTIETLIFSYVLDIVRRFLS